MLGATAEPEHGREYKRWGNNVSLIVWIYFSHPLRGCYFTRLSQCRKAQKAREKVDSCSGGAGEDLTSLRDDENV